MRTGILGPENNRKSPGKWAVSGGQIAFRAHFSGTPSPLTISKALNALETTAHTLAAAVNMN
jgi:hypothetical protein